jgi:hypothetical protein
MLKVFRSMFVFLLVHGALDQSVCFAEMSAEAHLRKGVSFLAKNQDQPALDEFRQAYALVPSAQAAAQMALAERSLEMWVEAERHLTEALSSTSEAWIERNRFHLEEQLTQIAPHLGGVRIEGPSSCTIQLNGADAGKLPIVRPLRAVVGELMVGCLCQAALPQHKRVIIIGGKTIDVIFDEPRPAPTSAPLPGPRVDQSREVAATNVVPTSTPAASTSSNHKYPGAYVAWNKALLVSAIAFGTAGTAVNVWDVVSRTKDANSGIWSLMGSVVLNEIPVTLGVRWLYNFSEHKNHRHLRVAAAVLNVTATAGLTTAGLLILNGEKQHSEDNKTLAWTSISSGIGPLAMVACAALFSDPGSPATVALLPTSNGVSLAGRF